MRTRQGLLCASLILVAYLLQVTLLARLGIPGATPDLVLVVVVALALAYGPMTGAICGFSAGMLVDLAPPAAGPVGIAALLGMGIGALAGGAIDPRDRTVPLLAGVVALAAGAMVLGTAAIEALLGTGRVSWPAVPGLVLTAMAYAVLLAPLVIPGVAWLARRLTADALAA